MTDSRVFVQALVLGFSPSAADSSKTSLNVIDRLPFIFDFGPHPRAWFDRHLPPTVFDSEEDARAKVDDLVARCRGIVRVAQKLGHPADIGKAELLFGRNFDGQRFGGYEVAPFVQWEAERDEETRVDTVVASEQLAAADSEVQAAQAKADAIRAELVPAPRAPSDAGKWVATDVPKIQSYRRQDGTESFRGRDDGKVSPSYPTLEEAVRWVEGDRDQGKVSDERTRGAAPPEVGDQRSPRTEALNALEDKMVRS